MEDGRFANWTVQENNLMYVWACFAGGYMDAAVRITL